MRQPSWDCPGEGWAWQDEHSCVGSSFLKGTSSVLIKMILFPAAGGCGAGKELCSVGLTTFSISGGGMGSAPSLGNSPQQRCWMLKAMEQLS